MLLLCTLASSGCARPERGQILTIFNAAALGPPFRALGDSLRPAFTLYQENVPSLEAIRRVTELGRIPDILATADAALFDALIVPGHSDWYVEFGTNALVIAYGPHSAGQEDLSVETWPDVLLRPGVRTGRSDPSVDPSGYRTLMALELAERYFGRPGLAAQLRAALPVRYVRRAEADLSVLIEAGELDYIWTYRNLARAHRLEYLELPPELNLSSPDLAEWYSQVTASVGGASPSDSLVLRGAPIVFALTVPRGSPNPGAARAFLKLLLSDRGDAALRANGFEPLPVARVVGTPPLEWREVLHGARPGTR